MLGYGVPRVFTTYHAVIVPSLAYAQTTGGGGTDTVSPVEVVTSYGVVFLRSSSNPIIVVSFWSASSGIEGAPSSKASFCHLSSVVQHTSPISAVVLSPTRRRIFAGSHPLSEMVNAPGGRTPLGKKFMGRKTSADVSGRFASCTMTMCFWSTCGSRGPAGAKMV